MLLQDTLPSTNCVKREACPLCEETGARTVYRLPKERLFPTRSDSVVACSGCGHRYLYPLPDDQELQEIYKSDAYWSMDYFNGHLEDYEKGLSELEQVAPSRGELLDVGCASGVFLNLARTRGWHSTGIDPSQYASRRAEERFGLSVIVGVLGDASFSEGRFDAVTLWDVLEHLRAPSVSLREIWRILKPGGHLVIQTNNVKSLLYEVGDWSYRLSLGRMQSPVARLYPSYHLHYFTEETLKRFLERNGFKRLLCLPRAYPVERIGISGWTRVGMKLIHLLQSLSNQNVNQFVIAQKT